jgi:hypothetical protein
MQPRNNQTVVGSKKVGAQIPKSGAATQQEVGHELQKTEGGGEK